MNTNSLVSVIIPVYNAEKYLDRCISSVVEQSHKELEIILIDDGSSDSSAVICDGWVQRDQRIRCKHQQNSGVSSSRNQGIKMATGAYLMMVDSDDYIYEKTIEYMLEAIECGQNEMVVCDFEKGTDDRHSFNIARVDINEHPECLEPEEVLLKIYGNDHDKLRYVVPWCKLYRRSLFDGIRYPDGRIFEDIYTTHQIIYKCNHIAILDQPFWYYYQHESSIMNQPFHVEKQDYLEALADRVDFFREKELKNLEQHAYDELLHSLIWEYSRARDVIHDEVAKQRITKIFRKYYMKDYASLDYPEDSRKFLKAFYKNPEKIIRYWRWEGKLPFLAKMMGR